MAGRGGGNHFGTGSRDRLFWGVKIDDQAVGVGSDHGGVDAIGSGFQHNAGDFRPALGNANLFYKGLPYTHLNEPALKFGGHKRVLEVEVNAVRSSKVLRVKKKPARLNQR